MSAICIRQPRLEECASLTELCLTSKAHWGYDAAFMEACADELAVTAETIEASEAWVAETGGEVAGYAELIVEDEAAVIEKLFVLPRFMGNGVGNALFNAAKTAARNLGASRIVIESDPGAEAFYNRMGAIRIGTVASGSIAGRLLPKLEITLSE